ncbi:hypothetical protein J2X63_003201 [Agromyces sp. 3263]|uniref:hypothetical protein n=1 Tax=Agromyces sp. 3263 TaxID=2817750 RepID=UPI0028559052|nr:hypothetical protein [Agromyces sp. 3263]MDR6907493.1 hypothetical protein [Agromyces sp. 3263]
MNEYPEWLIEKVARHLSMSDIDMHPNAWRAYSADARDVLNALGFAPWGGPTYWRSNIQWEAK